MPRVLHTDVHQKWTGHGIHIKNLSKKKPQYICYSVLQTKVKFVVKPLSLLGSLWLQ